MSSITYHFGGKEGLYLAAAEYIAAQMNEHHRPALEAIAATPVSTRADAIERLVNVLDELAATMLGEQSARWAQFITREQQEPTEAFDRIYSIAMRPMTDAFIALIAVARPDLSERERRATGFLLFGQAMALRAGRASLCRVLGLDQPDAEAELLLRRRLAEHTRAILSAGPEILP